MSILPHRDKDPILRLYAHYFQAADLMRQQFSTLNRKKLRTGKLSTRDKVDSLLYIRLWLGCLYSVCEGLHKLNLRVTLLHERPKKFLDGIPIADELISFIKKKSNQLRKFRNSVFHFSNEPSDEIIFFQNFGLNWAEKIHDDLERFFSSYRVSCEAVYLTSGRLEESSIRSENLARRQSRSKS